MGPGRDGYGAAVDAEALTDLAYLEAARKEFADKWDILEVPWGYLAVPAGALVVQASTIGGLAGKLRRAEHEPEPDLDTAYTVGGPRDGKLLDMRYGNCWPATAHCRCGQMLRREAVTEPWEHTGRMPGDSI